MACTLGPGVSINVDRLVESRLLIQANSGAGKSWAIRRLLEQTYKQVQQIVIDVEGEFHTLREKFDYVLAGQKGGDCPADLKSAAKLAERLLELNVSAIVDIYELGVQRARFVRLFLEALVNARRELWHPALIIVDEAHMFAPEAGQSESASAVIDLMTRGRKRGFCGVLATQRIAKLHKDAAAEANNKLIGRSALDIDMKRASAELGFTSKEDQLSLRTLKPGQFYAFGPALSETVVEVKIGAVSTTHPKAGERASAPTPPSAKVRKILAALEDLPAEAEAEARTAAELREQVKQLKRDLAAAPKAKTETKTVEIKVPVLDPKQVKLVDNLVEKLLASQDRLAQAQQAVVSEAGNLQTLIKAQLRETAPRQGNGVMGHPPNTIGQRVHQEFLKPSGSIDDNGIGKGPLRILAALIQFPNGLEPHQLTTLTGYKTTSRYEFLRQLKAKGLVDTIGDKYIATPDGREQLPDAQPLPTGSALRDYWLARLDKGERVLFKILLDAWPAGVDNLTLEENSGYKTTSRYEYVRKLAAKELVIINRDETKAAPMLFEDA